MRRATTNSPSISQSNFGLGVAFDEFAKGL
jgi:hypothetical protein